jgi:arylsulfatase A-like enzyme
MPSNEERPDLLFVLSDQHRASALGCANDEPVETPALDRLAADGTRLTRTYATTPVCAPSRASILTGLYPGRAGVPDNGSRLDADATTLGEVFSEAGYRTCYVGKWHLRDHGENYRGGGAAATDHVRLRGFDRAVIPESAHAYFDVDHYRDDDTHIETEGYAPTVQTDAALELLDDADDRPTCLVLSYGPPHNPYEEVPDKFRDRYDPATIPLRPNVGPILPYAGDHPEPTPLWAPPISDNDSDSPISSHTYEDPREGLADYYAQITAVDHEIGRLLDAIDDRGAVEDTIVAYTSDHGDQLWSQGHGQKSVPYDESVNVPLIVRWPDAVPAGSVTDALFGLIDLAPTLYGLAGIDSPPGLDGEDLSGVLRGECRDGRDAVPLVHHNFGWCGVRTERYTYAQTEVDRFDHLRDGGWLFFDNETDPYQLENRLYDPDYAEARAECKQLVENFLVQADDPCTGGGQTE